MNENNKELQVKTTDGGSGSFSGGRWTDAGWQEQARRLSEADDAQRFAEAQAYKTQLRNAGRRVRQRFEDVVQRRNAGFLEAVNNSFRNDFGSSVFDKDVLGGEMNDENNVFEGAQWVRRKAEGNGFRMVNRKLLKNSRLAKNDFFAVAAMDPNSNEIRYSAFSPVDILRKNRDLRILDPDVESNLIDILLDSGIPENRLEETIGYMPNRDRDSIVNRTTGAAGGREIGGTPEGFGKMTSRLFGRGGNPHSRISVFGTDGNGGYMNRYYDGHTGEDTGAVYGGRWADGSNGKWKVTMSGSRLVKEAHTDEKGKRVEAQYESGKMYENSKTGEEIWVPAGSSLRQVMANAEGTAKGNRGTGRTFDEQRELEQMRIDAREKSEKSRNLIRIKDIKNRQLARLQKERDDAEKAFLEEHGPEEYLNSVGTEGTEEEKMKRAEIAARAAARTETDKIFKPRFDALNLDYDGIVDDDSKESVSTDSQAASSVVDNSSGAGEVDIGGLSKDEAKKKLHAAPNGSTATIGGKQCVKRNGEWVVKAN